VTVHTGERYTDGAVSIDGPSNERSSTGASTWPDVARRRDDVYYFSIYEGQTAVGQILLHDIQVMAGESLVAYEIYEPQYRGRGIGTRALALLQRFASATTTLNKLVIITFSDNIASQRIAEKRGFRYAGASREDPTNGMVYVWQIERCSL
jgi:RimJ/RimL family protein N-acetyltransferase